MVFLPGMLVSENDAIELLGTGAKMGVSYKSLSSSGIPLTTEPFFKSLLVAMYRNHIHELLSRSRILLPPEEARLMMGVMDELGVLKPGQVCCFICIVLVRELMVFLLFHSRIQTNLSNANSYFAAPFARLVHTIKQP